MKRKRIIIICSLLAGAAGVAVAGWFIRPLVNYWPGHEHNVLSAESTRVLEKGDRFVLYSLDPATKWRERAKATWALTESTNALPPQPEKPTKEKFHEYDILGSTEVRDRKERTALLRALKKGIGDSDGTIAACFNPRHGISATLNGETVDLVICFECLSIATYAKDQKGLRTTSSPKPKFDAALKRAGLPLAVRD